MSDNVELDVDDRSDACPRRDSWLLPDERPISKLIRRKFAVDLSRFTFMRLPHVSMAISR